MPGAQVGAGHTVALCTLQLRCAEDHDLECFDVNYNVAKEYTSSYQLFPLAAPLRYSGYPELRALRDKPKQAL